MTRLACTCPSCGRRMGYLSLGAVMLVCIVGLAGAVGTLKAFAPPARHSNAWYWWQCMAEAPPNETPSRLRQRMEICQKAASDFCHARGCTPEKLGPY